MIAFFLVCCWYGWRKCGSGSLFSHKCGSVSKCSLKCGSAHGSTLQTLHGSISGLHGFPWHRYEPRNILNIFASVRTRISLNQDPAFHANAGPYPAFKKWRNRGFTATLMKGLQADAESALLIFSVALSVRIVNCNCSMLHWWLEPTVHCVTEYSMLLSHQNIINFAF